MKFRPLFIATLAAITIGTGPVLAQPDEPSRPVLKAAIEAGASKRLEAARFFRTSYPGLVPDVYSHLKADYPKLERGVVDAWLATRAQHPAGRLEVAVKVRDKFGPRMQAVRKEIAAELEASYPDFKNRLAGVLDENGGRARIRAFLTEYDPELLGMVQGEVKAQAPGWYPGKLRQMWLSAEPGTTPVLDRLRGLVAENPQLAANLVRMARTHAPNIEEDMVKHFMANRGQLIDALKAEFPGAGQKIVGVIERTDPSLPVEVARFIQAESAELRADFRRNLEAELPGLEDKVKQTVSQRYPDLQRQMLSILKG